LASKVTWKTKERNANERLCRNNKVNERGEIVMPEVKGIIQWYRNQDMSLLVMIYMSVSYVLWGLLEGLK